MNEKILKALGEELSSQVKTKLDEAGIELAVFNDGSVVPSEKYENLKKELKASNDERDQFNTQVEELKKLEGSSDELKTKLETITNEYEAFKKDSVKREQDNQKLSKFKDILSRSASPDAIDLLLSTVNVDELQTNEAGEIVDGQSKVDRMLESRPSLKITTEINGNPVKDKQTKQKEVDYSAMTDEEYFAAKRAKQKG